jgi:hypothetical protein
MTCPYHCSRRGLIACSCRTSDQGAWHSLALLMLCPPHTSTPQTQPIEHAPMCACHSTAALLCTFSLGHSTHAACQPPRVLSLGSRDPAGQPCSSRCPPAIRQSCMIDSKLKDYQTLVRIVMLVGCWLPLVICVELRTSMQCPLEAGRGSVPCRTSTGPRHKMCVCVHRMCFLWLSARSAGEEIVRTTTKGSLIMSCTGTGPPLLPEVAEFVRGDEVIWE